MKAVIDINIENARKTLLVSAGSFEQTQLIEKMSDEEIKNQVMKHIYCWGITEEQAIDRLHEISWMVEHDKEMTRPTGDTISRETLKQAFSEWTGDSDSLVYAHTIYSLIDNAPTVDKRQQGEWIPVSERLPEDMQQVLIWFEYYRYGDYNCMYQTYGFGYVCDGKWSSFINGETGWRDARIIAWMPLPEPYKKGGAE